MKQIKKLVALALAAVMTATALSACAPAAPAASTPPPADESKPVVSAAESAPAPAASGEIYYLNFKPEIAETYAKIAETYKAETGISLRVETAASGTYEQVLKSEMAKATPPDLFQINGPVGYAAWKDYCADMKGTEIYNHLSDKTLAVTDGDGVYGVPYVVEGYGIIYNNAIMTKYFALAGAKAKSMDEINSFATLKAVVEDMTAQKDALGIKGVFASTSLKPGEDWRWQTHLANLPLHYEFVDNKVDMAKTPATIEFKYSDNMKNILDLYINNSVTAPKLLGSKSVDDSMAEFALGQAAMVQNGNWGYSQINGVDGNVVKPEDAKFMPVYVGAPGEEKQGLCIGTENYLSINSKASAEQQKLAADFLYWLYSSDKGKAFVTKDLGFIAPFDTFTDADKPSDPLGSDVMSWMNKDGFTSVTWDFAIMPNQSWKDKFGASLLKYAQGSMQWDAVKTSMVADWATEAATAS